nr:nucleotide-binding protein [uncultured Roseateles sp.]
MNSESSLFRGINNAVLDLQRADTQAFPRAFQVLARRLEAEQLSGVTSWLTTGLDVDAFLAESEQSARGMAGSAQLAWPERHEEYLGLCLLLIKKFKDKPNELVNFSFNYFHARGATQSLRNFVSNLVIPFARDFAIYAQDVMVSPEHHQSPLMQPLQQRASPPSFGGRVFIVHGHDELAKLTVARVLEGLGLTAIVLHEQASRGKTIIEKIEAYSDVDFAVVLLTPDDVGGANGQPQQPRARQNVLLELGYFMAKLGRERVFTLRKGDVEIASDFAGVVWEAMDSQERWKFTLVKELRAAGFTVDANDIL